MYFISCGNQRIFTSRDFIQQGLSRGNESSDGLVFEVKFVSKVCSEQKSRQSIKPQNATAVA